MESGNLYNRNKWDVFYNLFLGLFFLAVSFTYRSNIITFLSFLYFAGSFISDAHKIYLSLREKKIYALTKF